ncbi:hypothetical protein DUI87_32137 [Hirundo rustica rustica]|uniref:GIPC GH2 domain-containing protein n=1 Tax=Hirundo rustica rustica TaxID=333673 RepID=A0A3M0J9P4_HIRRU|nr:hypothetical protein DUI87_32137 [Hirundo rustica rustica]
MARTPQVGVGDVLEALDGRSLVGARHFEVARLLQELPRGQRFQLSLTEPGGPGHSAFEERAVAKVDDLLESYMGIRGQRAGAVPVSPMSPSGPDVPKSLMSLTVLSPCPQSATMVELGRDARDPDALAEALDSQLGDFAFPDEFVFDVWGAIGDAKAGRG